MLFLEHLTTVRKVLFTTTASQVTKLIDSLTFFLASEPVARVCLVFHGYSSI